MDIAVAAGLSLFLLLGAFCLFQGGRNVWRAVSSTEWPTAPGTIAESAAESEVTDNADGRSTMYSARIVANYRVDGRDYTTATLHFGQTEGSDDSSEAELRRLRYPPGAAVLVHYDPKNPQIAALEPGFESESLLLLGAGLGFGLPGLMFMVLYWGSRDAFLNNAGLSIGLGFFSVIFVLIGLAMLVPGAINLWRAQLSTQWPTVPGEIVYGVVDSSTSIEHTGDGQRYRSSSSGARLIFRYEVAGRDYFSNTRRFGQLAGASGDWAAGIAEKYPLGAKVQVSYDPANPRLATMEPGFDREALWLPGAGAAFLLFGLAVYVFAIPALTRNF